MAAELEAVDVAPGLEAAALLRAKAGALLDASDLQAIFHLSVPAFYRWAKRGAWDPFRVAFPGGAARYSGVLVWRYLEGVDVGADRARAYFGRKGRR